jgi:hypothetical protein
MQEKRKEIIYCNLTLQKGKDKIYLKNVVYKYEDGFFKNTRLGIKEPLKVLKVEKIESLGFENKSNLYTEVKKSNEKRNNITGAYE